MVWIPHLSETGEKNLLRNMPVNSLGHNGSGGASAGMRTVVGDELTSSGRKSPAGRVSAWTLVLPWTVGPCGARGRGTCPQPPQAGGRAASAPKSHFNHQGGGGHASPFFGRLGRLLDLPGSELRRLDPAGIAHCDPQPVRGLRGRGVGWRPPASASEGPEATGTASPETGPP